MTAPTDPALIARVEALADRRAAAAHGMRVLSDRGDDEVLEVVAMADLDVADLRALLAAVRSIDEERAAWRSQIDMLTRALETVTKEREEARASLTKLLDAIEDLAGDSGGVYGLHRNGDPAPWDSLRTGGEFESWLGGAIDDAHATIRALAQPTGGE